MKNLVSVERIENSIFQIRGKRVMLDIDLSKLYRVPTKVLNQVVKRNMKRFPGDFMFKLTEIEKREVVTNCDHLGTLKFSPHFPYAFTEQGVAMLSSVLNSERAIEVNIIIMRAFVRLREILMTHKDLAAKIAALELKYKNHDMRLSEYDKHITAIFEAIRQLMAPSPEKPRRTIGFKQT